MKQKFWIFLLFIGIGIALLIYFLSSHSSHSSHSSPFSSHSNPHSSKFQYKECSIKEPYIHPRLVKNVVTPQEAKEIIKWAKPHLGDAEVITYARKDLKHRNNKVAWLPKSHHLSKKIINKVAQATNMPVKNFEDVQVCYYAPGNFFKYHQDQCHDRGELCRKETEGRGGTRVYNLLLYLNSSRAQNPFRRLCRTPPSLCISFFINPHFPSIPQVLTLLTASTICISGGMLT